MKRHTVPVPKPSDILHATSKSIEHARTRGAVAFFHAVADRVPAYKDFLRRHKVFPAKVRNVEDLRNVPPVDKKNYLRRYPLEALCWDGTLGGKALTYTSTSGSTGEPFYFPRDHALDFRSSIFHEMYFRTVSRGRKPSTLVIVTFGMGVWIGGLITYQAFRYLAERGYPITTFTPGMDKQAIFRILAKLAPKYDQVILCGYPPFLKDVLDEAPEHGFRPGKTPLKLLFAAEGFSETFRQFVMEDAGAKDPCRDTANIYGSADIGTMAMETPISIGLRRAAIANPSLYKTLFSSASRLPTLAQFHPSLANFEQYEGELLVSGDSALPLVRYAIGDHGGVLGFDDAMSAATVIDRKGASAARRDAGRDVLPLPFVYVYERADFSTSLYGLMIYAEHVRASLQVKSLSPHITGKFSMGAKHDARENQYFDVHVELKKSARDSEKLRKEVVRALVDGLGRLNSEYHHLRERLGDRAIPRVHLMAHEHPEHFRPGGKQKWIKK